MIFKSSSVITRSWRFMPSLAMVLLIRLGFVLKTKSRICPGFEEMSPQRMSNPRTPESSLAVDLWRIDHYSFHDDKSHDLSRFEW